MRSTECLKVLIVGAGGHGQVVADILWAKIKNGDTTIEPVGYLDDNKALHDAQILELPVVGTIAQATSIRHDAVIVATGDNALRRRICQQLISGGERLATAIHPRAIIGSNVEIGSGSVVCAGVVVNAGARVGMGVILNTGCTVDHHNQIQDYAQVAPGAHLGGHVNVHEGVLIGIGASVTPDRSIGAWAVVGAGSVVLKDVPPKVLVVGVPAYIKKQW